MSFVVCLPWTYEPYFDECMETVKFPPEKMLIINNSVENVGIMKAHNRGVDFMRWHQADWLIILSAAIRFGPSGGLDFAEVLEAHPNYYVIHAASENVVGGKQQGEGGGANEVKGWHLTAFHRTVFENIGIWDENFTPYGLDDIDLSIRIQKFYGDGIVGHWDTFPCDVHDTGVMGHSINLAHVKSKYHPRNAYFTRKWGREGGQWDFPAYDHPFDDESKPLSWWPAPEDPLSIQSVEFAEGGGYEREEGWV